MLENFFNEANSRIPETPPNQRLFYPEYPEDNSNSMDDPINIDGECFTFHERFGAKNPIPITINDKERDLLDGGVRELGFDVFAFYKSRRNIKSHPYPNKWGIFYIDHGLTRVKELIELTYPGFNDPLKLAYLFLKQHERFHFKFDFYSLSVEAQLQKQMYAPLKHAFYKHKSHQVEEALANRDAWEWAKQPRIGLDDFAFDFMKLQPRAYSRFDEDSFMLQSELSANLFDSNFNTYAQRDDQALWIAQLPKKLLRDSLCPEYVVRPQSLNTWINPQYATPAILMFEESKEVKKILDKHSELRKAWELAKIKLLKDKGLPALHFKPWRPANKGKGWDDLYQVRLPGSNACRAHLKHIIDGKWLVTELGSHKDLGHGK